MTSEIPPGYFCVSKVGWCNTRELGLLSGTSVEIPIFHLVTLSNQKEGRLTCIEALQQLSKLDENTSIKEPSTWPAQIKKKVPLFLVREIYINTGDSSVYIGNFFFTFNSWFRSKYWFVKFPDSFNFVTYLYQNIAISFTRELQISPRRNISSSTKYFALFSENPEGSQIKVTRGDNDQVFKTSKIGQFFIKIF